MRSAVLKSGLFRLNARRTFSTCRVTISYTGGGGWSGPPYKKFANNFKDFLASEFDSSEVNVTLQQLIGQDAITSPHDFVITLLEEDEVLHKIGFGEAAVEPTEMEGLMIVSKIGGYLAEQRK